MIDIIPAMKCGVSLAIGLAVGYASGKVARIIGNVSNSIQPSRSYVYKGKFLETRHILVENKGQTLSISQHQFRYRPPRLQ